MSWAQLDPNAEQTLWDKLLSNEGTLWDAGATRWDLSFNVMDNWTKPEAAPAVWDLPARALNNWTKLKAGE